MITNEEMQALEEKIMLLTNKIKELRTKKDGINRLLWLKNSDKQILIEQKENITNEIKSTIKQRSKTNKEKHNKQYSIKIRKNKYTEGDCWKMYHKQRKNLTEEEAREYLKIKQRESRQKRNNKKQGGSYGNFDTLNIQQTKI